MHLPFHTTPVYTWTRGQTLIHCFYWNFTKNHLDLVPGTVSDCVKTRNQLCMKQMLMALTAINIAIVVIYKNPTGQIISNFTVPTYNGNVPALNTFINKNKLQATQ